MFLYVPLSLITHTHLTIDAYQTLSNVSQTNDFECN